jgi:hypothetical protein
MRNNGIYGGEGAGVRVGKPDGAMVPQTEGLLRSIPKGLSRQNNRKNKAFSVFRLNASRK